MNDAGAGLPAAVMSQLMQLRADSMGAQARLLRGRQGPQGGDLGA